MGKISKKTIRELIVFVGIIPLILSIIFGCCMLYEVHQDNQVVALLEKLKQEKDMVFISDPYISCYDGTNFIHKEVEDISLYYVEDLLFVDDEFIYLYTKYTKNKSDSESKFQVYSITKDLETGKEIYNGKYSTDAYIKMYDDQYIYIFDDNCYRYDIENNTVDICDKVDTEKRNEYGYDIDEELIHRNYSITLNNGENDILLTEEDFESVAETSEILSKYKFFSIRQAVFSDNCAYIICSVSLSTAIVYQYNFDTDELSYYSWSEIFEFESLEVFVID